MFQYVKNDMGIREKTMLENADRNLNTIQNVASIAFVKMAEKGDIDETTATEHMNIFSPWAEGIAYNVGDLRVYGDGENQKLYKCVQAHTSQSDWTPSAAASLWTVAGDPTVEYPDWSQPLGAHDAYQSGDKVSYEGAYYVSTTDGNVWAPGVYGWELQA